MVEKSMGAALRFFEKVGHRINNAVQRLGFAARFLHKLRRFHSGALNFVLRVLFGAVAQRFSLFFHVLLPHIIK